jgi:DNA-binding transcriptional MerR regulator
LFTVKQASRLTGVPAATLRTWERRYVVVSPARTASGYRLYDSAAIASLTAMRKLVAAGWSPSVAAEAIRSGQVPVTGPVPSPGAEQDVAPDASRLAEWFLEAAAAMDSTRLEQVLDYGFALGSFEHVVDSWLCPALVALGDGWARGEIDVAGEHTASHAVLRRLAAAFDAAASRSRGPSIVVGLPPDSHHELGALAFATAARRVGLDVLYLGANVPIDSWEAATRGHHADAAVLAVVTAADRPGAEAVAQRLVDVPGLIVATGGAFGTDLATGVLNLPDSIALGARELEDHLHSPDSS